MSLSTGAKDKPDDAIDSKTPKGAEVIAALRKSGVVGMWKDRTDIGDSSEFARQLREKAQTRGQD